MKKNSHAQVSGIRSAYLNSWVPTQVWSWFSNGLAWLDRWWRK